jgi:glycosyltransferase involved in cell wall biosynthesis
LFELYRSHDLFLFPSLHDSGGFVVLEALAHGLPVVCLDLGGPKDIVTSNSGVVVRNNGQDTAQIATAMAREISRLVAAPDRLALLSAGAVSRAHDFILAQRIDRLYDCAMKFIAENYNATASIPTTRRTR